MRTICCTRGWKHRVSEARSKAIAQYTVFTIYLTLESRSFKIPTLKAGLNWVDWHRNRPRAQPTMIRSRPETNEKATRGRTELRAYTTMFRSIVGERKNYCSTQKDYATSLSCLTVWTPSSRSLRNFSLLYTLKDSSSLFSL